VVQWLHVLAEPPQAIRGTGAAGGVRFHRNQFARVPQSFRSGRASVMAQAPQRPRPIALRIELLDVAPLVWRRVLVSNQWTLASLHGYLQWAMGWTNSHAHEFEVGDGIVAPEWWIQEVGHDSDTSAWRDE